MGYDSDQASIIMKKLFLTCAFVLFASQARAECSFDSERMAVSGDNCPKDVADIVERTNSCIHFQGEPYSLNDKFGRERKKFLDQTIRELRCRNLGNDQKAIKQKYRNSPGILGFLEENDA